MIQLSHKWLAVLVFVVMMAASTLHAQESPKDSRGRSPGEILALYAYNLPKDLKWHNEDNLAEFRVVLIGRDADFEKLFLNIVRDSKIRSKTIRFSTLDDIERLGPCEIVVLTKKKADLLEKLLQKVERKPTLIISQENPDRSLVMLNILATKNGNPSFEVNRGNILMQRIEPKSDLVLRGGSEIDVAGLYRDGEASLSKFREKLRTQEAQVEQMSRDIALNQSQLEAQKAQVNKASIELQKARLEVSGARTELDQKANEITKVKIELATREAQNDEAGKRMAQLRDEVADSEKRVADQEKSIVDLKGEKDKLLRQGQEQAALLRSLSTEKEKREKEINVILADINRGRKNLEEGLRKLDGLNQKIADSEKQISSQQLTITQQQNNLRLLAGLIVLSVIFAAFILRAFQVKKRFARKLEEAQAELVIAKEQAVDASKAKSVFLASMSHEIRTPMNAILGYAQIMEKSDDVGLASKANLEIIRNSGNHLLSLINEVLEMSRIEAGKIALNLHPGDFASIIEEVRDMFALKANDKHLQFEICPCPAIPGLEYDEGKLRQILVNMVGNALKFTARGSVKVHTSAELAPDGRWHITVKVSDSGPGIPEDEREKLFEPFEQTRSRNQKIEGTGLGMPISRRYARLMGGELKAIGNEPCGSVFILDFFAAVSTEAVSKTKTLGVISSIKFKGAPPKLLVVDDVEIGRRILRDMLTPYGFIISEAGDGKSALDAIAASKPDLILSDVHMPGMSGIELVTLIHQSQLNVPTILLSASALEEDRKLALAAQPVGFIAKPYLVNEVLEMMRQQLHFDCIYQSETQAAALMDTSGEKLSPALLAELRKAATVGALSRIISLVPEIRKQAPLAADEIQRMADDFDIAGVKLFVDHLSSEEG